MLLVKKDEIRMTLAEVSHMHQSMLSSVRLFVDKTTLPKCSSQSQDSRCYGRIWGLCTQVQSVRHLGDPMVTLEFTSKQIISTFQIIHISPLHCHFFVECHK